MVKVFKPGTDFVMTYTMTFDAPVTSVTATSLIRTDQGQLVAPLDVTIIDESSTVKHVRTSKSAANTKSWPAPATLLTDALVIVDGVAMSTETQTVQSDELQSRTP